jgi:hypothetical protein
MNDVTTDWLGDPVADDSWLEISEIEAPKSAMPYDGLRFACMRGSGRVWACDGEYMAFRPFNHALDKAVNPAFEERIARFRADGHFKHLGTFDEVQVYQLLEGSPWKSSVDEVYTAGQSVWKDTRHAAKLAIAREWKEYVDMLEAVAVAMKAGRDPAFAVKAWEDFINQVMINVYQSQGPLPGEIRAGIQNVMQARKGARSGTLLVTDITQSGDVQYEGVKAKA